MTNIVLAGFMGTGKTTIGQTVADRLGMPFVDLDEAIEAEAGQPIAHIFATQGEVAFRSLEAQIAGKIATKSGQVIATGGGTLLNTDTRAAFARTSLLVCLTADPEAIIERVSGDEARPLAQNREALIALMGDRAALYASLPYHVDTTDRTPEQVAKEVIRIWTQHSA